MGYDIPADHHTDGPPPVEAGEYEDDRYEVLRAERPELMVGRVIPASGGMTDRALRALTAHDDALIEKDKERFTAEQRASALAAVQAYLERHPSPHAARDKTEEWDMNECNQRIKDRKQGNTPLKGRPGQTDGDIIFEREDRFSDDIDRESVEAQNIVAGGCVQEGFPGPIDERMPGPLDWSDQTADIPILPDQQEPVPGPILLSVKDTNPKDAVGTKKWRQYCTVPTTIIWELGVAMLEGARKYGRHNYRVAGVRASVYIDAAKGHIDQWWEGEDIDEESRLNHIIKAIASLAVLRDAMIQNKWVDDRPPRTDLPKLRAELQEAVNSIFERVPEAKDAYLEGDQHDHS